ncbi:MAG: hypothetical protein C0582_03190 [Alphaproteobacteria bacterium]|nr:MAG: hypothetical protein C0582_03190 [Alphaproteobacteria bacterium]
MGDKIIFKLFNGKTLLAIALLLPMCCVMGANQKETIGKVKKCIQDAGYDSCVAYHYSGLTLSFTSEVGNCKGVNDKAIDCINAADRDSS